MPLAKTDWHRVFGYRRRVLSPSSFDKGKFDLPKVSEKDRLIPIFRMERRDMSKLGTP